MDLIFGVHSIREALKNPLRTPKKLYTTPAAQSQFAEFQKASWRSQVEWIERSPHALQEEAKGLCRARGFDFQRVPSGAFLLAQPLPEKNLGDLYSVIGVASEENPCRLLLLDGVTDAHNVAAILRSAAFYNARTVILSRKGGLNLSPGFFRIASGATEHVTLINVASLPKAIQQLHRRQVALVGLSEDGSGELPPFLGVGHPLPPALGLALGDEHRGLSHGVKRSLQHHCALIPQGPLAGLNVSVAAAAFMQKIFRA